jgi:hypothetical protein
VAPGWNLALGVRAYPGDRSGRDRPAAARLSVRRIHWPRLGIEAGLRWMP